MLIRLKNKLKTYKYKRNFPQALIDPTAHISLDSSLGIGTVVGVSSIVSDSRIGDNVKVMSLCNICDSSLGAETSVGSYSSIKTSEIGGNVNVMPSSKVLNSVLDSYVTIHDKCSVNKSVLKSNVAIYEGSSIHAVDIGRYSYFASGSHVSMAKFGSFCSIGPYLICGYGDHPVDFVSTSPVFFSTGKQCGVSFSDEDLFEERKEILVGHDVWIGARVFIRDGIKIGNGVIIAAGSVVVKDVPDYAIVGGIPAQIIRYRFTEKIMDQLLDLNWWDWNESKLRHAQKYFASNDINSFIDWCSTLDPD